ncbi:ATP-dependent DNA helicase RecG [Bifidobacterium pseudocatenulatum]|uniref:ATP-dependent DNA helicase RecG n=1 Tax=Bifidobacterium pseudocatenulatum TaxID=28026 RepID=UPI00189E95E3|nr:ATP-dependent DNA helicase RecG [Bifidobacterium pseudocatenulatum]MDB6510827.1 ATP-dependent DNA helicase RecG [Bifidobacterium pseudocatenulatum]MDB6515234.1 ATP-dependent DNA helicase RecG [Bifidobacterium pseudocatenulatum]
MSTTLETPISSIESNRRRVGALKSLGVVSVGDALTYYPFRVTDPVPARSLHEAKIGEKMAFAAHVLETRVFPMARRGFRLIATVTDDDFAARRNTPKSLASLVFFSYRKSYVDWVQRKLHAGALLVVAGEPSVYDNRLQFTHPDLLTINPVQSQSENGEWNDGFGDPANPPLGNLKYDAQTIDEALKRVCRPRPVYHATSRISSEHIHESVLKYMDALRGAEYLATQNAGNFLDNPTQEGDFDIPQIDREIQIKALGNAIPDIIPEDFREEYGLMHRAEAFMAIHDPVDRKNFDNALQTLRYEEALICQTALVASRDASRKTKATACSSTRLKDDFIASLPFTLTNGQQQVIADISADMAHDYPMQRLLQGEVGSGKTVVAVAAMMQAVGSGGQAVLVAPTQVLAEQHYASISTMVSKLGKSDANSSDNQKNLDDANARRSNKRSAQSSKDGEFDAKTIHNNAVDKGVQLADLLDLAASDDVETGFSGKGNDIFGKKDGEIPVFLLTGSMRLAERRRVLAAAASGMPCIVVATHAAFSKSFQAPNLTLAVIDEQHRFGVEQRESLNSRGSTAPHLLVMTATPIPRTAAMTWFGDLDISALTELPGGRKPIRTFVVPEDNASLMGEMFALIRKRIDAGERAYVVCPRIDADAEDADGALAASAASGSKTAGSSVPAFDNAYDLGEDDDRRAQRPPLHSVAEITERLQSLPQFKGIRFATLTGRDDDATKTQVMADFESGITPILVATTVIEVGVDVAKASCIVIFDADRYGLSQLHQLRGRVGRGGTDSGAFLISRAPADSDAARRLDVIQGTLDGAEIAQADLEFRGAGDVLGDTQSGGKSGLKLLRVVKDVKIIEHARVEATRLVAQDPDLLEHVQLAGAVLDFTRGNETFLTSN